MIKFDFETYLEGEVNTETFIAYSNSVDRARNDFLRENNMNDWYQFDMLFSEEEMTDIERTAAYVRRKADLFIVIGVGGSYLGAKGMIDALTPYFKRSNPEIIYAGNSLSGEYLESLIDYMQDKEVVLNVISKSGNTLETMVAFEALYRALKVRYNDEEIKERIIVTTDREQGHLLEMAKRIGCKRFVFPANVGGRFSTLTTVGLFPICVAGIDIRSILDGARSAKQNRRDYYKYLAVREHMYSLGKYIEVLNVYEPKLEAFSDWIQQIFAETQGKFKKGILPVPMVNTGKLHSLGQYLQEGTPIVFETSIDVEKNSEYYVEKYSRYMDTMNSIALKSVALAHHKEGRYTGIITIDQINPYNMGYLYAFFSIVSTLGAYMEGNNYANQPGVEKYKEIMNEQLNI